MKDKQHSNRRGCLVPSILYAVPRKFRSPKIQVTTHLILCAEKNTSETEKKEIRAPYSALISLPVPSCLPACVSCLPCCILAHSHRPAFIVIMLRLQDWELNTKSRQGVRNRLAAAVARGRRNAVAWANLDVWLCVVGGCGSHPLLDLPGHGQESLLDVAGVLCGRLEEWDSQAVGELLLFAIISTNPARE